PAPGRSESAVQKWNLDVPREKLGELTQPSTPLPVPKFSYLHHGLLGIEKTRVITQPNVIKAFAAMFLQEAHRTTRNYSALQG
ncbi:MAG: hypothetical protein LAN64_10795, partial [Acidobacteriia bacterium]|nr:hypothetical protein [Terriglobia bacterium]